MTTESEKTRCVYCGAVTSGAVGETYICKPCNKKAPKVLEQLPGYKSEKEKD